MTQAFWGPEPWRWESGGDGELEQLLGVTHKPSLPSPRWCLVPLIEPENLKTFLAVDLRVPQTVPQIDSLFPPSLYLPPPCILLVNGITFYWADQAGQLLCICHPLHHWVLLLSFIFCKAHIFFLEVLLYLLQWSVIGILWCYYCEKSTTPKRLRWWSAFFSNEAHF